MDLRTDFNPAKPHAFLSYTRADDEFLKGGITALRRTLEQAVQAVSGKPIHIWQDVDDIEHGDEWQKKLDQAIEAAQLFIPIITPSFFTSEFCRREAEAFLEYEACAGRNDLVLPIYLMDTPKLDDEHERAKDPLAERLHERQYVDWRKLRFELQREDTLPRIEDLARTIARAIAMITESERQIIALKAELKTLYREIEEERARKQLLEQKVVELETGEDDPPPPNGHPFGIPPAALFGCAILALLLVGVGGWKLGSDSAMEEFQEARGITMRSPDTEVIEAVMPKEFVECSDCPEMVVVPAGSFYRVPGSTTSKVNVSSFAIGKYEVTFEQWSACAEAKGCDYRPKNKWENEDLSGWDQLPVVNVSWNDAQQFVAWLTKKTGEDYRLPSDDEWEYAARAGSTTLYSWGEEVGDNEANCRGCGSDWDMQRPALVGQFDKNDFGIYDMHGNVWELLNDPWYEVDEYTPSKRVSRGGAWNSNPEYLRLDYRGPANAGERVSWVGFRVAKTLVP